MDEISHSLSFYQMITPDEIHEDVTAIKGNNAAWLRNGQLNSNRVGNVWKMTPMKEGLVQSPHRKTLIKFMIMADQQITKHCIATQLSILKEHVAIIDNHLKMIKILTSSETTLA